MLHNAQHTTRIHCRMKFQYHFEEQTTPFNGDVYEEMHFINHRICFELFSSNHC